MPLRGLEPGHQPLNILIVEDDEDDALIIRDLLQDSFKSFPPVIRHMASPSEALNSLDPDSEYDLCMFDYRLGEMHGIELIEKLREKGVQAPIIVLTGQGDQEVAVEAMKSGATDYLVKGSLTSDQLTQSINYAINLHKKELEKTDAENKLKQSHLDLVQAHGELKDSMNKLQTAQNQVLRTEKLASIGRLAAGVCHEILNPLNIISGHVQVLQMEREVDQPLMEDLKSIAEEIIRIEKIVGGLLKFSRKGDMDLTQTNINDELKSILTIVENEMILQNITVKRRFDPSLPKIYIDSDRMRQVFLNIINNAKYAMEKGGTLTVTTEGGFKTGGTFKNCPDSAELTAPKSIDHAYIRLRFSDTGQGIKKENMEKLFDPFFTTKPEDKGTGLGLSVCFTIVEKHGGVLEVESEYGHGAAFIIDLPLVNQMETEEQQDR